VLLLADPADQIVPIMTAQRLAGELPHARLRLISDAGHHLPRRAPAAVAEAIAWFVAALDQNGRQRLGLSSDRTLRLAEERRPHGINHHPGNPVVEQSAGTLSRATVDTGNRHALRLGSRQ
jgi:hypothetical protein